MQPIEIKRARKSLGLTQTQAGQIIGAAKRTWQSWEKGTRKMSLQKWSAWCALSGYTANLSATPSS